MPKTGRGGNDGINRRLAYLRASRRSRGLDWEMNMKIIATPKPQTVACPQQNWNIGEYVTIVVSMAIARKGVIRHMFTENFNKRHWIDRTYLSVALLNAVEV